MARRRGDSARETWRWHVWAHRDRTESYRRLSAAIPSGRPAVVPGDHRHLGRLELVGEGGEHREGQERAAGPGPLGLAANPRVRQRVAGVHHRAQSSTDVPPVTAHRRFVLVSGLPASGKSTLARAVAPLLRLPVIDKDDILERLFETKGIGDLSWRRQLSRESDALFQAAAAASDGAVLTSFWHVPGMPAASGTPTQWLADLSPLVVELRCLCPAAVASARFLARQRHQGHLDGTRDPDEVRRTFEELEAIGAPILRDVVEVGTTTLPSAIAVAAQLEAAFSKLLPRTVGDSRR